MCEDERAPVHGKGGGGEAVGSHWKGEEEGEGQDLCYSPLVVT